MLIRDAAPRYLLETLLTNLPKQAYQPVLRQRGENPDEVDLPYTCLLIQTGSKLVLVDTGMGSDPGDAERGKLLDHLRAEGIDPSEIGTVVISHAHPDHVGGILAADGMLVFPSARYAMFQQEWDFWMANPGLEELPLDEDVRQEMVSIARKTLERIEGQVNLLHRETAILRGIVAVPAFGHTPGHMALGIRSSGEELLFVADAILHPLNLEFPQARAVFDHQPETMAATRLRLLQQAAKKRCLLSATHFPFPGLGRVVSEDGVWQWQPVSTVVQGKTA